METMALDNVIRFPESLRGSASDHERARTLMEARNLAAQKLREAIRSLLAEFEEDLLARGDAADERDQRNFCYGGRELVRESGPRVEGLLSAHWQRLLDTATRAGARSSASGTVLSLDDLQLVELGDMDEQIAVKALASSFRDGCEDGLFALGRRFSFLGGTEEGGVSVETILADAIDVALKEADLPGPLRVEALNFVERRTVKAFAPMVHDLNAFLVGRHVLPTLRRSYARPQHENKSRSAEANKLAAADSSDLFSLLQRLVGGGSAPATATTGVAMSAGAMTAAMEQMMVTLDALQKAIPEAAVGPTSGVLREFRSSTVGQGLGHLDAVTVDIVATLFDFIFDDPAIADPIKALVARMQIPVLKVAMLDKSFFSSKSHPARRLLDSISHAAVRCGPGTGHDDPLYEHIALLVERLQAEFSHDAALFDVLCGDLNTFLEGQEGEADARAARAAPLVAERERRELAAVAADAALAGWLSTPLPVAVADLLTHEWRTLLVRYYLNDDQIAWDMAISTAGDLVASVQPQTETQGRKMLAARLPTLVKQIHDGLDRLQVAVERRLSLIDCLFSIHAAVLRGAAPVVTTIWPQEQASTKLEIVSESVQVDHEILDSISLVDAENVPVVESDSDAQRQVDELQRGDWVEFSGGEAGPMRYRLSWVSPERGILLFTSPQLPRALSVAPAALALQLERGEAAIMPVEPIFERAVTRALETLKAA
jgi:hypothetical protein